jgi:hypothetical protein
MIRQPCGLEAAVNSVATGLDLLKLKHLLSGLNGFWLV